MITCQICGFEGTMLGRHVRSKHAITPDDYLAQFPGHVLTDKSLREKMSNSNVLKGKVVGSLIDRFGVEEAVKIKERIGTRSGASRKGKARPQQGETLKRVWAERRESWSAAIAASFTPERRERASAAMKQYIKDNGPNLPWGKETAFESITRTYFEQLGFTVESQFKAHIGDTTRFFDMFIPQLNMLVECDGEYWHSRPDRIAIDESKNQWAIDNGYALLRLSDAEFPTRVSRDISNQNIGQCFDVITERMCETVQEQYDAAIRLVKARVV